MKVDLKYLDISEKSIQWGKSYTPLIREQDAREFNILTSKLIQYRLARVLG